MLRPSCICVFCHNGFCPVPYSIDVVRGGGSEFKTVCPKCGATAVYRYDGIVPVQMPGEPYNYQSYTLVERVIEPPRQLALL